MLAETADRPSRGPIRALHARIIGSRALLLTLLVFALLWPWLNLWLWDVAAPTIVRWLDSDRGWGDTWDFFYAVGFPLGIIPILASTEGVLQRRANGSIFPMVIYALAWIHWAALAGLLGIAAILKVLW